MKMKHSTIIALAAISALTIAAPAYMELRSDMQGSVQFFTRWDCRNPCVEHGTCYSPTEERSGVVPQSINPWIGWSSGCFDRPGGIHSISLSMSNGHGFKGVNVTCTEFEKLVKQEKWDAYGSWGLETMSHYDADGSGHCSILKGEEFKAVVYDW